jgi:hypothetical protein
MSIQEMLSNNLSLKKSLNPNLSIGYHNSNSIGKIKIPIWLVDKILDSLGKKIRNLWNVSLESSIGSDSIHSNIPVILLDLLLLL